MTNKRQTWRTLKTDKEREKILFYLVKKHYSSLVDLFETVPNPETAHLIMFFSSTERLQIFETDTHEKIDERIFEFQCWSET
jgi:hypothetical protein